ncbi:MAG: hypothetical protein JO150_13485 [Acidobacteriaceae bacterium]|nr:hypothetical protein [Acidobacteriaceae bacterium]
MTIISYAHIVRSGGIINVAQGSAHSINLTDLENAISSAVEQVKSQKLAGVPDLGRGPILTGRYIREASTIHAEAQGGLQQAAEHITQQINSKVPGLNAKPVVEGVGTGHILIGIILREQ